MAEVIIRFLVAWVIASIYLEKPGVGAQNTSVVILSSHFSSANALISPWYVSSVNSSMPWISSTPSSSLLDSTFILTQTAESSSHVTAASAAHDTVSPTSSASSSQTTTTAVPPTSSIMPTSKRGDGEAEETDADKRRKMTLYMLYACLGVFFLIFIILIGVSVQVSRLNKTLKGRINDRR